MKIGENGIIVFNIPNLDLSLVDKIIFTFQGVGTVKKNYPSKNVSYDNGKFFVGLNQEDTIILAKELKIKISAEAQINFKNGSVIKSSTISFMLDKTLATEVLDGNTPSMDVESLELRYEDGVLVAGSAVEIPDEQIRRVLPGNLVTTDDIGTEIASYIAKNPDEVKGDKGDKGEQGIQGKTGADGKSAYQIAVDDGFTGTESEWLASLKGADGNGFETMTKAEMLDILRGGDNA